MAADDTRERAGHGDQRTYSPRGIAPDGTYVGQAGGREGPIESGDSSARGNERGEGTYGYPYGPGVGIALERHPDDEARDLRPFEKPLEEAPLDRFGTGRAGEWLGHRGDDPDGREAEFLETRRAFTRELDANGDEWRRRGVSDIEAEFERWRAERLRERAATNNQPQEDSS